MKLFYLLIALLATLAAPLARTHPVPAQRQSVNLNSTSLSTVPASKSRIDVALLTSPSEGGNPMPPTRTDLIPIVSSICNSMTRPGQRRIKTRPKPELIIEETTALDTIPPNRCPVCVPYSGQVGDPFIPGYKGRDLIARQLANDNKPFTMTILHTNDIHSRYDEFSKYGIDCSAEDYANRACYGGIARIKTVVDKIRASEPNTYLLDAGDQFQGSLFYAMYKGNVTAEWMNMIGYDAWALGNHEFDDGPAHLAKFLQKLAVPTLSSNINATAQPELNGLVAPYVVLTKYHARIGIVGYITPTTPDIATVDKVLFVDPVQPVQRAVDELRQLGVERIVCVSHNGYKEDMAVAQATRGIAVIVGGHSHTLLHTDNKTFPDAAGPYPTAVTNLDGEKVYIVQAKAWGEFVGHLQLSWGPGNKITHINGEPIHLTMDIPQHKATQAIVQQWRAPFDEMVKQVIGRFTNPMPYSECKTRGCRLGYFVADALRFQYSGKLAVAGNNCNNGTVIGMVPMGALRSSFSEVVTVGDVLSILPYGDPWVETVVSGQYLVDLLENVAAAKHKVNGRPVTTWMQFAGLRAKVDRTKPEFVRVLDVQVEVPATAGPSSSSSWVPIALDGRYIVVAQEFVMSGGDNVVPTTMKDLPKFGVMSDMLIAHIKKLMGAVSASGKIDVPNDSGVAYAEHNPIWRLF